MTTHTIKHLKAATACTAKDYTRAHLMQVRVSPTRLEATNGHLLIRIEVPRKPGPKDGAPFAGCVSRYALDLVGRAPGVAKVAFNGVLKAMNEYGIELTTVAEAPRGKLEEGPAPTLPPLDAAIPPPSPRFAGYRTDLMLQGLRAAEQAGFHEVKFHFPAAELDPLLIVGRDREGAKLTLVVMPYRLSDEECSETEAPAPAVAPYRATSARASRSKRSPRNEREAPPRKAASPSSGGRAGSRRRQLRASAPR